MRRVFLPLIFLLLAATSSASAVRLSDGEGQVLIFPYFTVNAGLDFLLQVSELRGETRALKVRILEGNNGREVLEFNVYLPPFATWTAAIHAVDAEGPGRILSPERVCTVPTIAPSGQPFLDFFFTGTNADGGSTSPIRMREGHVEIIEMGVLEGALADAARNFQCGQLHSAWFPGEVWDIAPQAGLLPPIGGLTGTAALVDFAEGVIYSYRAVTIDGFSGIVQHGAPGNTEPHLGSAAGATADAPVQATWTSSDGENWSASWPRAQAIDAVSAVLARTRLSTRFNLEPIIDGSSEWILNFPTKRFYTDNLPGGPLAGGQAIAPFLRLFRGDEPLTSDALPGGACMQQRMEFRDREGRLAYDPEPSLCFGGDPRCGPARLATCHVTQAMAVGQAVSASATTPLLGSLRQARFSQETLSTLGGPRPPPLIPAGNLLAGYGSVMFEGAMRPSLEGIVPQGLPVIALGLKRLRAGEVQPGVLANYASVLFHSGQSEVVVEEQ